MRLDPHFMGARGKRENVKNGECFAPIPVMICRIRRASKSEVLQVQPWCEALSAVGENVKTDPAGFVWSDLVKIIDTQTKKGIRRSSFQDLKHF